MSIVRPQNIKTENIKPTIKSYVIDENKVYSMAQPLLEPVESPRETQHRLRGLLQSTLDIEELLNIFFKETQASVPIASLRYTNKNTALDIAFGRLDKHICNFSLLTNGDVHGNIEFSRNTRFTEHELTSIEMLLGCLIFPLRNALTYCEAVRQSLTDPLTQADNRLSFENTIHREFDLARRHKMPLSILMIDVDYFKIVNDSHGHIAGDYALKKLVEDMQHCARLTDTVYRYGGEEFAIILHQTPHKGAILLANKIKQYIEQQQCIFNGNELNLTVSIGVATLRPNDEKIQLIERADKSLYRAKMNGRNQVHSAEMLN